MADYDSNPLIQALDAKRKAAEEALAALPQVVSIATRQAWEPPAETPTKAKRVRKPKVDKDAIETVEGLLARLRAGEVFGFVGLTTERKDGTFTMFTNLPAGETPELMALRYIGGVELLKCDLMEIADFGLEGAGGGPVIFIEGDVE